MFHCFAALAFLTLGDDRQCSDKLAAGLALARDLGHPPTLVVAQHIAAQIHQLRSDAVLAHEFAKQATELAEEYGLELWRAYGIIELGWAEAELGNVKGGIEQMQRGLALHESESKLRLPYFLALLADQLGKMGRLEEGLAEITKALTVAEHTGEGFALPELYRIKGDLLMKTAGQSREPSVARNLDADSNDSSIFLAQAQTCLARALAIAKQQQAVSWESKIVASMERLKQEITSGKTG
jgi:predicted ATPase